MRTHTCPRCGEETAGAYSEGGILWAICERCMEANRPTGHTEDYYKNIADEQAAQGDDGE